MNLITCKAFHTAVALAVCCLTHFTALEAASFSTNLPPAIATPEVEAEECRARGGLPNFLAKVTRGDEVRIGYFGGSITAQEGWRPKTLKWFQQQYPKAKISQINAAIGGTGSDLGVFRCRQDVLEHKPDLLFVEFAVNDGGSSPAQIYRCMEGIVRQTWKQNPETDICFVYTLVADFVDTLASGKFPRAAAAMDKLADHYGIPTIHMGLEVARMTKQDKVVFKGVLPKTDEEKKALGDKIVFSPDDVHPYPETGHQLYLDAVVRSMALINEAGKSGPHIVEKPFVEDHWEAAKIVPLGQAQLSAGWLKLDPSTNKLAKQFGNRLPELWLAGKPGLTIEFKFRGSTVGFYDLLGPDCGQLRIVVDDKPPQKTARFDSYCTYHRLGKVSAAQNLAEGVHSIKVETLPDVLDKAKILSKRSEKIDKPERFEGLNWYVGSILLIGDLIL